MQEKSRPYYLSIGLALAVAYWLFDSSIHYLAFDEPEFEFLPGDINELWMRTLICVLMIAFGVFAHISSKRYMRLQEEKIVLQAELNKRLKIELDVQKLKAESIERTVFEVHDVVNNFLNNLQLFRLEAEESNALSRESLELFDRITSEAAARIRQLGREAEAGAS